MVLGIKNSGADGLYLPLDSDTNFAIVQGLQQNGVKMKANILATGYSQDLLDQPIAQTITAQRRDVLGLPAGGARRTRRSSSSRSDLKKYAGLTGVPDYGTYTGYIVCDMMIKGLQAAGKNPTRQAFVDGIRKTNGGQYDGAGLLCQPIDLSYEGFGKVANKSCTWFVTVKDGKFKVLNGGKPETGKLVGDPALDRAVREQHRWGHHDGTASDRSTLTPPRSSCGGSRFAGSPRGVRGRAPSVVGESRYVAAREATAEAPGRSGPLGGRTMNHRSRRALRAIAGTTIAAVTVVGLAATGVGAQASTDPGVSAKAVKLGYIFSETGSAGSTFKNAGKACKARIDRARTPRAASTAARSKSSTSTTSRRVRT